MFRKILLTTTLAITVIASAVSFAAGDLGNFREQKTYSASTFSDVSSTDWYYEATKAAYEFGLMGGKAQGVFDSKGNLTLAEAVAIASSVHNVYNGGNGTITNTGAKWYDGAVNYAIKKSIIKSTDFSDYNKLATRAEMAYIFASTLNVNDYQVINSITRLPDVGMSTRYADQIFRLYNAGIIGGSDKSGTFKPSSNITRAETVAILKNLVIKSERKTLNLDLSAINKGTLLTKVEVEKMTLSYTATPESKYGGSNKPAGGKDSYIYKWESPAEPVYVKYGRHLYNSRNQREYDHLMREIEEAKQYHNIKTYDFSKDSSWQIFYKAKAGTASIREAQYVKQWQYVKIIEQYGEEKAKDLYIKMGLTGRIIDNNAETIDSIIGESAYEQITTGSDCNGASHLDSAVWDSYGYSTRILADNSHAWAQVMLDDGKWYNMDLGIGSQTTAKSYSDSGYIRVDQTY